MEAREETSQNLHPPRQQQAHADESGHDDADTPDEVLRQVEQAQQGRPQPREHRETDHKAAYLEVRMKAGGEAASGLLGVTACALRSRGEEDDGEYGQNARGDTRDEPS